MKHTYHFINVITFVSVSCKFFFRRVIGPDGTVVERSLREREVEGSDPGRAITMAFKWYQWLPCLVLSIIRQAQALALLSLTTNTTNIEQLLLKTNVYLPSTWFPGTRLMSPSDVKTYRKINR